LLAYVTAICFFFFFSSRRRHTRFSRDWSSDVCSSDLNLRASTYDNGKVDATFFAKMAHGYDDNTKVVLSQEVFATKIMQNGKMRSEERRVGKECRSRWSLYH